MAGSAERLEGNANTHANAVAQTIRGLVTRFARENPAASLTDLYEFALPRFYRMLLGKPANHLSTSHTMRLLRLNTETASLPRFAFVDLFLNPITRKKAVESYNLAVGGSDIYTLDQFGEGALPFDLVIPGRGRGTIRIPGDGTILVDTPREPIILCDKQCDFASVESLAKLVERELGPDVALVGKAVTLLPLLCAEHILVFHESASGYSERTRQMLALMTKRNLPVPALHPILRVAYHTWDALAAVAPSKDNVFVLPEFLAQALGREKITYSDFAYCWKNAISWETQRLATLAALQSPRALLLHLCRQNPDVWQAKSDEYEAASTHLLQLREASAATQAEEKALRDQIHVWKAEAVALEEAKGDDFRERIFGKSLTPDTLAAMEAEREVRFDRPFASLLEQIREAGLTARHLRRERKAIEQGETAMLARTTRERVASEAERERARQAKKRPANDERPAAYQFPTVCMVVSHRGCVRRMVCSPCRHRRLPIGGGAVSDGSPSSPHSDNLPVRQNAGGRQRFCCGGSGKVASRYGLEPLGLAAL